MLVKFSLCNYKTFREKAELNLVASNSEKDVLPDNVIEVPKFMLRLLKSAVIYGANASGKSKLLEALAALASFVRNSSRESTIGDPVPVESFWLSTETVDEPTEFEIVFIYNDVLYRYGFEATPQRIVAEWLFYRNPKETRVAKETQVFYRDEEGIEANRSFNVGLIKEAIKTNQIRENALLLSYAAQFNNKQARSVLEWFSSLRGLSGLRMSESYTLNRATDASFKERVIRLLKAADIDIDDFVVQEYSPDELPDDIPEQVRTKLSQQMKDQRATLASVQTVHQQYNEYRMPVEKIQFSMKQDESAGTNKFFALTGPILDVLDNGYILGVDELDAQLHPNLVSRIVALFHSPKLNPRNAQLIFNTHNTNLLNNKEFRRDQLWFTNKDNYGAVTLYSLGQFKKNGDDFEARYLQGRYAGTPYLGQFDWLLDHPTELIHAE